LYIVKSIVVNKFTILVFLTIASCTVWAQTPQPANEGEQGESLPWSTERPLTWKDFRADAADSSEFKALTDYKIGLTGTTNSNNYGKKGPKEAALVYTVTCEFNLDRSWVKGASETDLLLKHEQVHFDVAELYARKLRKELSKVNTADKNTPKLVSKMFREATRNCMKEQSRYDRETKHSRDEDKQKEWNGYVSRELKKFSKYSSGK